MKLNKKFFMGVAVIATWMLLVIFLPSCSSSNNTETCSSSNNTEKETTTTTTITKDVKVVDILEAVGKFSKGSVSVTYLLLENGDVITYTSNKSVLLPYTKEEAKQIMAFRRGEEVTVTIPVK